MSLEEYKQRTKKRLVIVRIFSWLGVIRWIETEYGYSQKMRWYHPVTGLALILGFLYLCSVHFMAAVKEFLEFVDSEVG